AAEGGVITAEGAVGQVHLRRTDAAAAVGDVVLEHTVGDVQHTPLPLAIAQDADAAAHPGGVVVEATADQCDVPRPRHRGVGAPAPGPDGLVGAHEAALDHQVGLAHPDAAPAAAVGQAVAYGQALEGDLDRAGGPAEHVEDPVQPLAVDDGVAGPRPLE